MSSNRDNAGVSSRFEGGLKLPYWLFTRWRAYLTLWQHFRAKFRLRIFNPEYLLFFNLKMDIRWIFRSDCIRNGIILSIRVIYPFAYEVSVLLNLLKWIILTNKEKSNFWNLIPILIRILFQPWKLFISFYRLLNKLIKMNERTKSWITSNMCLALYAFYLYSE